jgi:hypothetical protein
MKTVLRISVVMIVSFCLSCSYGFAQDHWLDATYTSTYSPSTAETHGCDNFVNFYWYCQYSINSSGNSVNISHMLGSGNGSSITNRCSSSGSPSLPLDANITIGKKKVHNMPSHTTINATATAVGTITYNTSVSGTAQMSAASSASASASGSLASAGSSNSGSLSVSGSCTASSGGTLSVT